MLFQDWYAASNHMVNNSSVGIYYLPSIDPHTFQISALELVSDDNGNLLWVCTDTSCGLGEGVGVAWVFLFVIVACSNSAFKTASHSH